MLSEEVCKKYWVDQTSLKTEDFHKSIVIKGKHKTNRVSYGVCSVGISSAYLKRKLLIWINLLAQDLIKKNYLRV